MADETAIYVLLDQHADRITRVESDVLDLMERVATIDTRLAHTLDTLSTAAERLQTVAEKLDETTSRLVRIEEAEAKRRTSSTRWRGGWVKFGWMALAAALGALARHLLH